MPESAPHPVDRYVGARIRLRRQILKVSQGQLAAALGVTFQQVQKYERGANRISASVLYVAARALDVRVEWFFEGLPRTVEDGAVDLASDASALRLITTSPTDRPWSPP